MPKTETIPDEATAGDLLNDRERQLAKVANSEAARPNGTTVAFGSAPPLEVSDAALAAMKKHGIDPKTIDAPEPEAAISLNAEQLAVFPTGHPGAKRESLPMVLIDVKVDEESTDYKGYKGYIITKCVHPLFGEIMFTSALQRVDDNGEFEPMPIAYHLLTNCHKGSAFKIGAFETRAGFTVYKPLPLS